MIGEGAGDISAPLVEAGVTLPSPLNRTPLRPAIGEVRNRATAVITVMEKQKGLASEDTNPF